jgi:hypothetical protein
VNPEVVWLSVKEGIPEAKPDIKRILDQMWIRKISPRGKRVAYSKEALQSAPYKAAKITDLHSLFS